MKYLAKREMKYKFLATIVLICSLTVVCLLYISSRTNELETVASIQANLIPELENNDVTFYLNTNWCQALKYKDRVVQKLNEANATDVCLSSAENFSSDDLILFERIKKIIDDNKLSIVEISDEKSSTNDFIGVSFWNDCAFCGARYLYSTNTIQVSNIQGEIKYRRLDEHWYKINQDPL